MKKYLRIFIVGVDIFAFIVLVDFIITLFNIKETGRYVGFSGLVINQEMTSEYMTSQFGVEPKMLLILLVCIGVSFIINILMKKKK